MRRIGFASCLILGLTSQTVLSQQQFGELPGPEDRPSDQSSIVKADSPPTVSPEKKLAADRPGLWKFITGKHDLQFGQIEQVANDLMSPANTTTAQLEKFAAKAEINGIPRQKVLDIQSSYSELRRIGGEIQRAQTPDALLGKLKHYSRNLQKLATGVSELVDAARSGGIGAIIEAMFAELFNAPVEQFLSQIGQLQTGLDQAQQDVRSGHYGATSASLHNQQLAQIRGDSQQKQEAYRETLRPELRSAGQSASAARKRGALEDSAAGWQQGLSLAAQTLNHTAAALSAQEQGSHVLSAPTGSSGASCPDADTSIQSVPVLKGRDPCITLINHISQINTRISRYSACPAVVAALRREGHNAANSARDFCAVGVSIPPVR